MTQITTYAPPRRDDDTDQIRKQQSKHNISEAAWWRLERQILGQEFTDITMQIMLAGADAGAEMLPPGLDVLIDWDVFNQSALDWMRQYLSLDPTTTSQVGGGAFRWVKELTETTRNTVIREIDNWVREGAALPVLEARLAPTFGSARARRIAVTEVTRVYAEGNLKIWETNPSVTGKRWQTSNDERVCSICGPMHNRFVEIDKSWEFTPSVIDEFKEQFPDIEKALKGIGKSSFRAPPAHVNCRCWLQPALFQYMEPDEVERDRFG